MNQESHEEHTLIEWFDDKLDEFHEWLNDIRDTREKNLETLAIQEVEQFPDVVQIDESTHISKESLWKFWLIWAIIALAWYFAFQSLWLIYLLIAGLILSMAVERFIQFFQKWMPRWLSMSLVYLLVFLFLISGIILVVPFIIQQSAELISMTIDQAVVLQDQIQEDGLKVMISESILPGAAKDSLIWFLDTTNVVDSMQSALVDNISQIVGMWSSYIKNAGDFAVSMLTGTFSALFQIVIVFMSAIFCTIEKEKVIWVISSFSSRPKYMGSILLRLYDKLWQRLVGQVLLSITVWVAVAIWLQILAWFGYDLPNKFTLSLIAGLTEFIPYVWPILWWLPALFVATLAYGIKGFLVTIILYYIIQRLENNLLVPVIMSQTLWVSPLLIFVTMLFMGILLGILWVIIAVPIAVIIQMVYTEYVKLPQIAAAKNQQKTSK